MILTSGGLHRAQGVCRKIERALRCFIPLLLHPEVELHAAQLRAKPLDLDEERVQRLGLLETTHRKESKTHVKLSSQQQLQQHTANVCYW